MTPDLEKLQPKLTDPLWRLCSGELYKIAPADGSGTIPFQPRREQIRIFEAIYGRIWDPESKSSKTPPPRLTHPQVPTPQNIYPAEHPDQRPSAVKKESSTHAQNPSLSALVPSCEQPQNPSPQTNAPANKILIPKARRLGISTALGIFMADAAQFRGGLQCSLIDQNASDAERKLDRIMRVALDNLPDWLRARSRRIKDNDGHISLTMAGRDKSDIYAGMNARGGSNDILWISEWGVLQHEDPRRSAKIRSGALPSARHGLTVVETTWAGGRGGDLWDIMAPSLDGTADDWLVLFFPWWVDPRNVSDTAMMDAEAERYLAKIAPRLERDAITLTEQQRRWYARERREQGIFMMRENPTFLDECWSSPLPGAIYAEAVDRARAEGRIAKMPVAGEALVNTSWDLGAPQNTVVWYWQVVGREIRIIDCDRGFEGTLTERVALMLGKGYNLGRHYLPHDAQQTERSGKTMLTALREAGLNSLVTVPRTHSIWVGINHLLQLFPALQFRAPQVDGGLEALTCYRQRQPRDGTANANEPIHDWASHPADALRTMAEAHLSGLFKFTHTNAAPNPSGNRRTRRGMKPMRVG